MFDMQNPDETGTAISPSAPGAGFQNPSDEEITNLLRNAKTIAVVGLHGDVTKPVYRVSSYMQEQGYNILPVNPKGDTVLGQQAYKSLLDVQEQVDIVNVFRRSNYVAEIVDQAIQIKAKAVWTQLEIIDEAAARRAEEAGLIMIMDKCLMVEHAHLLGKDRS